MVSKERSSLPEHPATVAALALMIAAQLRDLLERGDATGAHARVARRYRLVRLDIVAQTIRAAALLLPGTQHAEQAMSDQMAQALVHYIDRHLGIPFSPDALPRQYNVWTAMFAEQALVAAECCPGDARLADLRLCLV